MVTISSARGRDAARYALAALTARRSRHSRRPAGLVLLHHDVAAASEDPRGLLTPALGVDVLREQLRHLVSHYRVVSLSELTELLKAAPRGPGLPVALTFDDDLTSHHELVAPLLTELGLPATFFLTGTTLERRSPFWWHDLQQLFRAGGEAWDGVCAEVEHRWGAPRVPLALGQVATTIEASPPAVRDPLIERLRALAASLPSEAGLPAGAVRDLVGAGFEIGFHTRAHYQLQTLSDGELDDAMRDGRQRLTEATGLPLTKIAYPHGGADLRVAAAAAAAGFESGFTVRNAPVLPDADPLLVPRVDSRMPASRLALTLAQLGADAA